MDDKFAGWRGLVVLGLAGGQPAKPSFGFASYITSGVCTCGKGWHMAIGWLSVLQLVPWVDVISNAPKVAESAKKLWQVVGKKPPSLELDAVAAQTALSTEAQAVNLLQAQLTAAEVAISNLHSQMLASSELIKTLADQNTQLIKRVEVNRIRVLWLLGITVGLAVVVMVNLLFTFAR